MTFHSKPLFQTKIEQQRTAHYRLTRESSTRTEIEKNNFERQLAPINAEDVELPKLPLVRLKEEDYSFRRWVILGEIAQLPGRVILLNINDGSIDTKYNAEQLELVPPTELT